MTTPVDRSRPITLAPWEVKAFLAGRKSLLIRPVKPQWPEPIPGGYYFDAYNDGPIWVWWTPNHREANSIPGRICPFGVVGDELRGYETFLCAGHGPKGQFVWAFRADGIDDPDEAARARSPDYLYKERKWRSSTHMPRYVASRFVFRITSLAVQRIAKVSCEEAATTGVEWNQGPFRCGATNPISAFRVHWDQTHGKKPGLRFHDDPWVWMVGVQRNGQE